MMLSLVYIVSGGKELRLSKCALTASWDWPILRLSVLSASLYITQQYAKSAIAVLTFRVKTGFKYFNLISSVKNCESMALQVVLR